MVLRVVLKKVRGRGTSAIVGTIGRRPTPGRPLVVAFHDGIHEFITSTVVRVMEVPDSSIVYIQTRNSTYRMEIAASAVHELPPPVSKKDRS
jgi:hypothetical protein